jgi:hypothetical protein
VRRGVDDGPEGQLVRDLTVEPDVLVGGEQPSELRADDTDDVPEHGHQDEATIEGQHETGATGRPDGPLEAVKASKLRIGLL